MTDTTPTLAPPEKQKKLRLIFAIVIALVTSIIAYRWWWSNSHITTDNAQLEGQIIPISARVGGYVKSVPVIDNQTVSTGNPLVEIDPRDYAAKVQQAEADYQQALSSAGSKEGEGIALAQIGAAQANAMATASQSQAMEAQIEEARANVEKAQRDYLRNKELASQRMLSPAALDAAETTVKTAQAHVNALQAQLRTIRESATAAGRQVNVSSAGLKSAQAKVLASEATLQLVRNQLIDTRVLAPTTGVVSKKAVEPGQMIQSGQTLMYLVASDKLWVVANLKETELKKVQVGQHVQIEIDAYPDLKIEGQVQSFSPATGARFTLLPPDNATGNFTKVVQRVPVRIALAPSTDRKLLRPGMSVSVTIETR